MREPFVKQRQPARPGSIPDVLEMFVNEVRFYRELAPVVGVRVPACFEATESDGATKLTLENLSHWRPGAEPVDAARALAGLHGRWQGRLGERWPWLRAPTAAADLVGSLFDSQWLTIRDRPDLSSGARELGDRLQSRVPEAEVRSARSGPETLVHGDASLRNMRTGPAGEIALLDWEDVGRGPGSGRPGLVAAVVGRPVPVGRDGRRLRRCAPSDRTAARGCRPSFLVSLR